MSVGVAFPRLRYSGTKGRDEAIVPALSLRGISCPRKATDFGLNSIVRHRRSGRTGVEPDCDRRRGGKRRESQQHGQNSHVGSPIYRIKHCAQTMESFDRRFGCSFLDTLATLLARRSMSMAATSRPVTNRSSPCFAPRDTFNQRFAFPQGRSPSGTIFKRR
jgi:hypothetical protein